MNKLLKIKSNSFIESYWLGRVPYVTALHKMTELRDLRMHDSIPDQILFLEHEPVITMGRRDAQVDLKLSIDELKSKRINFIKTDRGGRLTYHGPGQLVVYFIFDLRKRRLTVEKFVRKVEEGLLLCLKEYGIQTTRDPAHPGLWVNENKIASVGFHITRGFTTHGACLNVSGDLTPFSFMIPCGIENRGVTCIQQETGQSPSIKQVSNQLVKYYEGVFACRIE